MLTFIIGNIFAIIMNIIGVWPIQDEPVPDMAQTIAGMEWQWSVERLTEDGSLWLIDRPWTCDRELAETWLRKYDGSRLVRQLVGPVEVAEP